MFIPVPILITLLALPLLSSSAPINFTQLICDSPTTTTLSSLLSSLSTNLTSSNFATATSSSLHGLALCRPTDTPNLCSSCISLAIANLRAYNCSLHQEAIVWQEWCMLRYSNRQILHSMETDPSFTLHNVNNVSGAAWMAALGSTVNGVVSRASAALNKFATKEAAYTELETLYSMAQCTPDLTGDECGRCLRAAISNLPVNNIGGIALLPSCNLRYETYPFYDNYTIPRFQASPPARSNSRVEPTRKSKGEKSRIVIVAASVVGLLVFLVCGCICVLCLRSKKTTMDVRVPESHLLTSHTGFYAESSIGFTSVESLQFDLVTLQYATQNFSDGNKIGEGGFGCVYKGVLVNGRKIAVKRLSKVSDQGEEEFKTEVVLLAKLQHKNLVRLLGFCLSGAEKLLVYEFVPNHCLSHHLFDPANQVLLDWPTRFKIIGGIARGMLYLHEDSRLKIIHRDLKASNILLDEDMTPKVADFGMARILGSDQTEDNTKKVAGTHGYMAPEYVIKGQYSTKSDVYSFGILTLEIITGKKNSSFHQTGLAEDLPSYAWENWAEGTPLIIMDPALKDISTSSSNETRRCIHLGLLCIQKDVDKRPTMAAIVHMLNISSFDMLPDPQQPDFFVSRMTNTEPVEKIVSDQSRSKSTHSANEASITQLSPR